MTQLTIGELLRRHRLDASLKQKELAELIAYDYTTISRVERNERLPTETYLEQFAEDAVQLVFKRPGKNGFSVFFA